MTTDGLEEGKRMQVIQVETNPMASEPSNLSAVQ